MSVEYSLVDDNGKIVTHGTIRSFEEIVIPDGWNVVEDGHVDGDQFYFNGSALTPRPEMPPISFSADSIAADGVEETLLQGVPAGATASLGNQQVVADGDDITLTTKLIGINRVRVELFPFKDWHGEFNGTEN